MAARMLEIVGMFRGEFRRWDETIVGTVETIATRDSVGSTSQQTADTSEGLGYIDSGNENEAYKIVSIKGMAPEGELEIGQTYRFYGHWSEYRGSPQFQFRTFTNTLPAGRRGTIAYLQHAPNIGKTLAERLWETYSANAVAHLREHPYLAAEQIKGLSDDHAREASDWLHQQQALEQCTIDLLELFASRGFSKRIVKEAIKRWGNTAAETIRNDPYLLMSFRGVGFLRADALYLDLGKPPDAMARQAYAGWHAVTSDTEGHTWHPVATIAKAIEAKIGGTAADPPAALRLAKEMGLLSFRRDNSNALWIAQTTKASAEKYIADAIKEAIEEGIASGTEWPLIGVDWPRDELSEHQADELSLATSGLVCVLAGRPGTGKTFTIARLARAVIERYGSANLALAAPTGKAAVRVSETLRAHGLNLQAKTIHSLLGVEAVEDGHWSFLHGPGVPLPHRFIIVDESSMIDTGLMASLLAARGPRTHILFVGDPYQLPPVGHGAPLRDFIQAGLPVGELKDIRRNSGAIVRACSDIIDRQTFDAGESLDLANGVNLKVSRQTSPAGQVAEIQRVYERIIKGGQRNPVWDVQVLVPVNARSEVGRKPLNKILQQLLNPAGEQVEGNPFRVGDKIICVKNSFFSVGKQSIALANKDGKLPVANGEMAEVVAVQEKLIEAKLANPDRWIKIPRGGKSKDAAASGDESDTDSKTDTGCDWDLGYAITVHKSQGSQWPVVLVVIDEYAGARFVFSREAVYTAISRAQEACILIGKLETAQQFCRRTAIERRKTFLKQLILDAADKFSAV